MRVFKTRQFARWAKKEGLSDCALRGAVEEIEEGLIDADLGQHLIKKRVPVGGRGKRGGLRVLIAYLLADRAFFVYGFAKNDRGNISSAELLILKGVAQLLLGYSPEELEAAIQARELTEVTDNERINH